MNLMAIYILQNTNFWKMEKTINFDSVTIAKSAKKGSNLSS